MDSEKTCPATDSKNEQVAYVVCLNCTWTYEECPYNPKEN